MSMDNADVMRLWALVKNGADLIEEALATHIYAEGEKVEG